MNETPQFERPSGVEQSRWLGRTAVQGALMGVMFAATYWSFGWIVQLVQPTRASAQETMLRQQAEYDASSKKSAEMAASMMARSEAILSKQEMQARRFDAVIAVWEKQTGIVK
jgi:hypothetical protein